MIGLLHNITGAGYNVSRSDLIYLADVILFMLWIYVAKYVVNYYISPKRPRIV